MKFRNIDCLLLIIDVSMNSHILSFIGTGFECYQSFSFQSGCVKGKGNNNGSISFFWNKLWVFRRGAGNMLRESLVFLLVFAVLLPVFSLLVSLPAMLRAAYEAELPARCFCGQTVQYRLTARHMAKLPVSRCRLRLTVSDAVGGEVRQQRLELAGTLGFALRIDTRHAGVQTFQPGKGRVCDALGLFSLPLRLPDACSIAVEPEPQEPPVLPNLSHFQYRSYHPKPGGGFSEIHDLREYRPGDSLHEIHWKLSAKTDKLIVREAEEPDLGLVVLSFDFSGTRTQLDSTLRQLLWLSGWLTEREVAHQIDWIEPDSLEPQTKSVKTPDDLRELLNTLLQTHLTGNTPSLASRAYPHADWRYHVQPEEQEVQQA